MIDSGSPVRPGSCAGLLLVALLAAACGEDARPRRHAILRVHQRHDLLGELHRAEVDSSLAARVLLHRNTDKDLREGPGILRAPARTRITWPALPTHGSARLELTCGLAEPTLDGVARAPVLFRVEARDLTSDLRFQAERLVAPVELRPPLWQEPWPLELPGGGSREWQLTLTTSCPDPHVGSADWPAWFAPALVSEGRRTKRKEHPVRLWELQLDLTAQLDAARVTQSAAAPTVAVDRLLPAKHTSWGEARDALVTHGPTRLGFAFTPDEGARLSGAVAVDQARGWNRGSDGVRFVVQIDGEEVWARRVDPAAAREDRRWFDFELDLSPWSGRAIELDLVTTPGGHVTADVAGWADLLVERPTLARRRSADEGPDVFVVVVDTLRADRLGAYGSTDGLTPRLDALAEGSLVFDRARSVSSWTLPATATLLTGLWPTEHGSLDDRRPSLAARLDTLAERFARAGWTTGAFVANPLVGRARDFDQGFETFVSLPDARAGTVVDHALRWLETRRGSAVLTYIHLLDPHTPYNAPPGHARDTPRTPERPGRELRPPVDVEPRTPAQREAGVRAILADRDAYDAEVRYVDASLGRLLDALEERGRLDDAVVLVTSDHGEEFLEHGSRYHGNQLYDESIQVPLLLATFGDRRLAPRRDEGPATLRDVLPTLLDLCGLPPDDDLSASLLAPRAPDAPQFAVTTRGLDGVVETTDVWSVVSWPYKLIDRAGRPVELYDLSRDPYEQTDLAAQRPDAVKALQARLRAWRAVAAERADAAEPLDDDTREWLRELGYLGK